MALRRDPLGPLRFSTALQFSEVLFWRLTNPPDIDAADDDEEYTVHMRERLDLLAFDKLGSSRMGHIILHRNNMRLWPNDLHPGAQIAIPTRDSLSERNIV